MIGNRTETKEEFLLKYGTQGFILLMWNIVDAMPKDKQDTIKEFLWDMKQVGHL